MTSAALDTRLAEAVERLVREFRPLKVFLFGSRARGDACDRSDLDLLVVLPSVDDRFETALALKRALGRLPVDAEVFVATPEEIARAGNSVGSFVYPVLR